MSRLWWNFKVRTVDILSWWTSQGLKFATLARIAKDILRAQFSSVSSESRAVANLKQRQDQLSEKVKKLDEPGEVVQGNLEALIQNDDSIKYASKTTYVLVEKVDGAVKEVQKQGQKELSQFDKTLKALIENQQKPYVHTRPKPPTYADKVTLSVQRNGLRVNDNGNSPKEVAYQDPPPAHPKE